MIHDRSSAMSRGRSRMLRATLAIASAAILLACELVIGDPPSNDGSSPRGGRSGTAQSGGRAQGAAAGAGGAMSFGGTLPAGGTDAGAAGFATVGGSGGTAAVAGAPSSTESGAGGAPEAGSGGAGGVAAPCEVPLVWYEDEDDDGYGTNVSVSACSAPSAHWSRVQGDCDDTRNDVHPGQLKYFGDPYAKPDGTDSFDYDCSGTEEPNPSLTLAPEDCGLLKLALCSDSSGYVTNYRTGPGIYSWCGSTVVRACVPSALVCDTSERTNQRPFSCR